MKSLGLGGGVPQLFSDLLANIPSSAPNGSFFEPTDFLGDVYKRIGNRWVKISTGGAGFVVDIGRAIQPHNRFITLAGSTPTTDVETMTWTAIEGVYKIRFSIYGGTEGNKVKVVFDASPVADASDVTQANNWLTTPSASGSVDVEYSELDCGGILGTNTGYVSQFSDWFYFSSPLRRADFLAKDADEAYTIVAEVG